MRIELQLVHQGSLDGADSRWRANCKLQHVGESLRDSHGAGGLRAGEGSAAWRGETNTFHPRLGETRPRGGITLTEVLISLGILTFGLLGVAALFPVGGWYMQKATIADNGSAIAQSVMNDMITRGTIDPKSWYAMVPQSLGGSAAHAQLTSDGKYLNPPPAPGLLPTTFTRPFVDSLSETLATNPGIVDKRIGNAFVIDPLYIAAATQKASAPNNSVAYAFPASAVRAFPRNGWSYYSAKEWEPWKAASTNERVWPIRRVTFQDMSIDAARRGLPLGPELASWLYRGGDSLVTDLPTRADRPARQNWDMIQIAGNATPSARQQTGDFSWLVTVAPQTTDARNGMATSPESFSYDVSVVVFYKRVLPAEPAAAQPGSTGINLAAGYERAVSARVLSTGPNGGELLLQQLLSSSGLPADGITGDPFQNLRVGEWIFLCGPHPNSTATAPSFSVNWYQVLAIDKVGLQKSQRSVVVRGPQWPWQPGANPGYSDGYLSNDLCVGIFRGAVAVHTKTIRLESEHGSGMALVKP